MIRLVPTLARCESLFIRPNDYGISGIKVGYIDQLDAQVDIDAGVWSGFENALDRLGELNVDLIPIRLRDYDYRAMRQVGLLISEAEAAVFHNETLAKDPQGYSKSLRTMLRWGARQKCFSARRKIHSAPPNYRASKENLFRYPFTRLAYHTTACVCV